MIPYLLKCITFQLVFLLIYDLLFRRETFFQWNRVYLIGTYALSMVLPLVNIEGLGDSVPVLAQTYPDYLWNTKAGVVVNTNGQAPIHRLWPVILYGIGVAIAGLLFLNKLRQIHQLRRKGHVNKHRDFIEVRVPDSLLAFSFFRAIFLGDAISKDAYKGIVAHELVHIRQGHSYDLLFFELMRIAAWFNPFAYIYQARVSVLHEYIADAKVSETGLKEQYQLLLSQVFQTKHISFINQFFRTSLLKKRIVMLQKEESKNKFKLKYLLIAPMVFAMLALTSSWNAVGLMNKTPASEVETNPLYVLNDSIWAFADVEQAPIFPGCENEGGDKECFKKMVFRHISKHFNYPKEAEDRGIHGQVNTLFTISESGTVQNIKVLGPHELLENEVKRIISKLPDMKPAVHDGQHVKVGFSVPIMFKLTESTTVELVKKGTEGLEPIFVVNGQPSTQAEVRAIDPDRIESMSVLKGEAAKKRYGEKGRNGVVQITLLPKK